MSKKHESCRLCEQEKRLVLSHIIPEFLYVDLYDDKHRASTLRPVGGRGKLIQKGLREELLCEDCEQLLNDRYEKPFLTQWRDGDLRPDRLLPGHVHLAHGLDYAKTKLFLLSVLWRAAVACRCEFALAKLGPHEPIMRQMLLQEDPGGVEKYPMMGQYAVDSDGTLMPFNASPIPYRVLGHRAYAFALGGCEWLFFVSSHVVAKVRKIFLQPDRPTLFRAILMKDLRLAEWTRQVR